MLHYRPRLLGDGYASLVDSPDFFLAADGRTNPRTELLENIRSLFDTESEASRAVRCRFPARFLWLSQRLRAAPDFDPASACVEYAEWIDEINPARAVLVFPAAYLNNPASMYGHTLLRLDPPDNPDGSTLYSYAMNFAAETSETDGLVFAVKGLLGAYPGKFSVMPYFRKVKEYSDLESRDIWEYPLDLTPTEIRFMLAHLWELRDAWFDYYFLDENCSYQLLALLQTARDELDLTAGFRTHAIPSDTLKTALQQLGTDAGKPVYRPSLVSRIRHRQSQLNAGEMEIAASLAAGSMTTDGPELSVLAPLRQAYVLDTAYEYLQYLHYRQNLPRDRTSPRALAMLRLRSTLPKTADTGAVAPPETAPHTTHGSRRLGLGMIHDRADTAAVLSFRPAYHDLLDPGSGFVAGAQINMFNFELRLHDADLRLETLELIDLLSLTPRDDLFALASWRINAAVRRLPSVAARSPLALAIEGGYGASWGTGQSIRFALLETGTYLQHELDDGHLPLLGVRLGLLQQARSGWSLMLNLIGRRYMSDSVQDHLRLELNQRVTVSRNGAVDLELALDRLDGDAQNIVRLAWQYYF